MVANVQDLDRLAMPGEIDASWCFSVTLSKPPDEITGKP